MLGLFNSSAFSKFQEAPIIFANPSVRPSAWNKWAPSGRIFVQFDFFIIRKSAEKFKFY